MPDSGMWLKRAKMIEQQQQQQNTYTQYYRLHAWRKQKKNAKKEIANTGG